MGAERWTLLTRQASRASPVSKVIDGLGASRMLRNKDSRGLDLHAACNSPALQGPCCWIQADARCLHMRITNVRSESTKQYQRSPEFTSLKWPSSVLTDWTSAFWQVPNWEAIAAGLLTCNSVAFKTADYTWLFRNTSSPEQ